jgi:hypothetical protein
MAQVMSIDESIIDRLRLFIAHFFVLFFINLITKHTQVKLV